MPLWEEDLGNVAQACQFPLLPAQHVHATAVSITLSWGKGMR